MNSISKKYIAELINRIHPVILDVGCHTGKDAVQLAKEFDQCMIHCFEPDPRIQKKFKGATYYNPKLKLHPFALGNVNGVITFHQSAGRNMASGSLRTPKDHLIMFPDVSFKQKIDVRCQALDRWYFLELHPTVIDFIWCDVNGAEGDFINGGYKTLKFHTRFLYIEFCERELYEGALTKQMLLDKLPDFEELGVYNFALNYGNVLLKNKYL